MYCVKATQVDIELTLFTEGKKKTKNKKTRKSQKEGGTLVGDPVELTVLHLSVSHCTLCGVKPAWLESIRVS